MNNNAAPLAQRQQIRKRTLTENAQLAETQQQQIQLQQEQIRAQQAHQQQQQQEEQQNNPLTETEKKFSKVDDTGKVLYLLKELEQEALRLDNIHSSVTDQMSRLQIEERVLQRRLMQIEQIMNDSGVSQQLPTNLTPEEIDNMLLDAEELDNMALNAHLHSQLRGRATNSGQFDTNNTFHPGFITGAPQKATADEREFGAPQTVFSRMEDEMEYLEEEEYPDYLEYPNS
jgi:preprotein translocase subunit SecD